VALLLPSAAAGAAGAAAAFRSTVFCGVGDFVLILKGQFVIQRAHNSQRLACTANFGCTQCHMCLICLELHASQLVPKIQLQLLPPPNRVLTNTDRRLHCYKA
jgi:hypothetical protein